MKTLQIIKQDQDKTISLVEHETTHTKYIQKELNYYAKHFIKHFKRERILTYLKFL